MKEAIEECTLATKLEPNNSTYHNNLGTALAGAGRLQEAIGSYQTAARRDPRNPSPYFNLGAVLLTARQYDDAIYAFERANELEPNNPKFLTALANAYNFAGKKNEAKAITKQLEALGVSAPDEGKEEKKKKKN